MIKSSVDEYLRDGCGRCDKFKTPACKVHRWAKELVVLRELVLASGLTEHVKWGHPCYTLDGKNVVMVVAFNDYCAISFLKGAALVDEQGVLEAAGPNSRFARFLKIQSPKDLMTRRKVATQLLAQAIELERAGTKVTPKGAPEPVPDELAQVLAADAALRKAFAALTPGRRRSHILHVGGAKQSETRARRVEKCAPVILAGRGFNER